MKNDDWSGQTSNAVGRRGDVTLSRDVRRSLIRPPPIYWLSVANQTEKQTAAAAVVCVKQHTADMWLTKADSVSRMYL